MSTGIALFADYTSLLHLHPAPAHSAFCHARSPTYEQVQPEDLLEFFKLCGPINFVRMAGDETQVCSRSRAVPRSRSVLVK